MFLFGRPRVFFDGDDKGGGGGANPGGDDKPADKGATDKKEFTQEQLDKMFGDTRKQGRDALAREIMEKTGFKSIEEAYAAIDAYKKEQADKLSEADRLKKEKEDAEKETEKTKDELRTVRFERDFDRTVSRLDLEFKTDKARGIALKLLDIETAGKDEKTMEEAVKGLLKTDFYLFTDEEPVETDATKRGKVDKKALSKQLIENKRKSGKYSTV